MTRTTRFRSNISGKRPSGILTEYYFGRRDWPVNASQDNREFREYCTDSIGLPYLDSDFDQRRFIVPDTRLGTAVAFKQGHLTAYVTDCPAPLPDLDVMFEHSVPNWEILAAKAMANANPNKPTVDLPLFIFELKDLPALIKQTRKLYRYSKSHALYKQKHLFPTLGETNLAYNFGLKPMVDDLIKMTGIVDAMQKHFAYLKRLEKGTKLKRQLGVVEGSDTLIDTNGNVYATPGIRGKKNYVFTDTYVEYDFKIKQWYTMEVELTEALPSFEEPGDLLKFMLKLTTGLYLNSDTAWNAVPFTWLIDWFSNFGDIVSLNRGRIGYKWKNLNLMSSFSANAEINYNTASPLSLTVSKTNVGATRSLREVRKYPYALPAFEMPILSNYQLGILGSLAITRKGIKN